MSIRVLHLIVIAGVVSGMSCGNDESTAPSESTPPAMISDLACTDSIGTSITLTWTAPGDDTTTGTAAAYDVRYAGTSLTEGNWNAATQAAGEPAPHVSGNAETMTVTGLVEGTTYCFGIKTVDDANNWSVLSNVICPTTVPPPAGVSDLHCVSATANTMVLRWTSPWAGGTQGTATEYDLRYTTAPLTEETWETAASVAGEPVPQAPGETETMTVNVGGAGSYYFALKARLPGGSWSKVSNVASGTVFASFVPDTLINCPPNTSGDHLRRGFYTESYPGSKLIQVDLFVSAQVAGEYTIAMTVRSETYDGPLIGRSLTTVTLTDDVDANVTTSFLFPGPAITPGSVVTFAMEVISGPENTAYYGTTNCGSNCATQCPVFETEGTAPPLDTWRRDGMGVTIIGIE